MRCRSGSALASSQAPRAGQEHPGGVGWVEARHGAGHPLGDLGFDLVEDRGEQAALSANWW